MIISFNNIAIKYNGGESFSVPEFKEIIQKALPGVSVAFVKIELVSDGPVMEEKHFSAEQCVTIPSECMSLLKEKEKETTKLLEGKIEEYRKTGSMLGKDVRKHVNLFSTSVWRITGDKMEVESKVKVYTGRDKE